MRVIWGLCNGKQNENYYSEFRVVYKKRAFNERTGIGTWWFHFTVVVTQLQDDVGMHQSPA